MTPKPINIGELLDTRGPLQLDVARLVETRMVVQASSGGGKSMTLRTILERTHGQLPHIILDKDGEFSTLREKHNYILAGKDGDIPADPRTAALLATKILELDASLIVDLYDLSHADKHRFVKLFLTAVLNAPKALWRPRLLVVDEAHRFCPENGEGISEAKEAVIECCDNGRKRGLGVILATQRIAKLDKSALAECGNKLIGLTNMDDDRRRAARELGFSAKEDILALRDLEPGRFFAVGPAVAGRQVVKAVIYKAVTSHPRAGHRGLQRPPAPTAAVKAMLAKLVDLPKEAEKDLQDRTAMQARIRELEASLRAQGAPGLGPRPGVPNPPAVAPGPSKAQLEAIGAQAQRQVRREVKEALGAFQRSLDTAKERLVATVEKGWDGKGLDPLDALAHQVPIFDRAVVSRALVPAPAAPKPKAAPFERAAGGQVLGLCERRILAFLRVRPTMYFSRTQVGAMSGYAPGGGGFNNAMSRLKVIGLIEHGPNLQVRLAPGADVAHLVDGMAHTLEDWIQKLGKCERAIYEQLLADPGRRFTKDELAAVSGYGAGGGGFNNAISRLATLGLLSRSLGMLQLNPDLRGL